MRFWDRLFLTCIIVGGLNWGLMGLFQFNIITFFFGNYSWATRVLYIVIGIAAIVAVSFYGRLRLPRD